ncbi:LysR substrate-binding domain-containing protein [Pelagibacterium xiamenense]|uniref:LysR substrate-binding domain-containing protein n=1 Tax=Pelagibacterium xiamenense TaxID=2901140 RepID=UPI001E40A6C0|nr:LysR substrate-binding domain-containing protein [Pelagibacterium xiamenense]MCD7058495.1 LysR substrate-binding domain-containing protein [Pelagibacterium xiamenense]
MSNRPDIAWLPLNALRAFAAVHETGSVGAAADALNVTHGAISQHLRGLEDRLQRKLFTRSGNRLVMAPDAAELAAGLLGHLRAMAADIDSFRRDENILNITVTPHFAQHWLLPRIGDFAKRHPQIDLRINADAKLHDLAQGDFDAAVRHGDGAWPGLNCERLLESRHIAVAAPSALASVLVETPGDLVKLPWILDEDRDTEMAHWFAAHGVAHKTHTRITRLPSALTLTAALDGHGVAWLPRVYAAPYLATGRLVQLFAGDSRREETGSHYYLCWIDTRNGPALRAFRHWLRRQLDAPPS